MLVNSKFTNILKCFHVYLHRYNFAIKLKLRANVEIILSQRNRC